MGHSWSRIEGGKIELGIRLPQPIRNRTWPEFGPSLNPASAVLLSAFRLQPPWFTVFCVKGASPCVSSSGNAKIRAIGVLWLIVVCRMWKNRRQIHFVGIGRVIRRAHCVVGRTAERVDLRGKSKSGTCTKVLQLNRHQFCRIEEDRGKVVEAFTGSTYRA